LLGIVCGLAAGVFLGIVVSTLTIALVYGRGPSHTQGQSEGATATASTNGTTSLTVSEFREAVMKHWYKPMAKKAFYAKFGHPQSVSTIGSNTCLYYRCADGTAGVMCSTWGFQYYKLNRFTEEQVVVKKVDQLN
jgi:hypothetical protein